jgi:hypothetical protein
LGIRLHFAPSSRQHEAGTTNHQNVKCIRKNPQGFLP